LGKEDRGGQREGSEREGEEAREGEMKLGSISADLNRQENRAAEEILRLVVRVHLPEQAHQGIREDHAQDHSRRSGK
jgi:hypothetical protein